MKSTGRRWTISPRRWNVDGAAAAERNQEVPHDAETDPHRAGSGFLDVSGIGAEQAHSATGEKGRQVPAYGGWPAVRHAGRAGGQFQGVPRDYGAFLEPVQSHEPDRKSTRLNSSHLVI